MKPRVITITLTVNATETEAGFIQKAMEDAGWQKCEDLKLHCSSRSVTQTKEKYSLYDNRTSRATHLGWFLSKTDAENHVLFGHAGDVGEQQFWYVVQE